MIIGKNGKWMWLTSKVGWMTGVLESCPQIVIDRFVLITSLDSGLLQLNDERIQQGWKHMGCVAQDDDKRTTEGEQLALSPRVKDPSILPLVHYDEWYVFHKAPQIDVIEVFVNYVDFEFSIGRMGLANVCTGKSEIEHQFWQQLSTINPQTYFADNGTLLFATADDLLFEQVVMAVQDEESQVQTSCDARSTIGPN